jgi:uncharacterized repeat protein (TIGR03837 family)
MQRKTWDIFCRIVDNFGDIGVCWRLAKQLAHEHGLQVRLFVDDLQVASKIIPIINFNKNIQLIDNIEIIKFNYEAEPAEVVIEAFACGLPESYQKQMTETTIWVNLEYLSAENWVADFHAKHSKIGKLTRHFYFPGFNENTGGLIREADIVGCHSDFCRNDESALKVSLFCYANAPLEALFHALSRGAQKVAVYAPLTDALQIIAPFFGQKTFNAGDVLSKNQLTLSVLPFLKQAEYDALLRDCDLNFVRGEDSWVRAIWAGKPFIWQPYVQSENAHITKLNAFLDVFYGGDKLPCEAHKYWSADRWSDEIWQEYLDNLATIRTTTQVKSQQLMQQTDLATKLVDFCMRLEFCIKP